MHFTPHRHFARFQCVGVGVGVLSSWCEGLVSNHFCQQVVLLEG